MYQALHRIREQFPTPPMAFSPGGRHANLIGPLGGGLALGSLVVVDQGDAPALVGQVQGLELETRQLGEVDATMDLGLGGAEVHTARTRPLLRNVAGELALVGTLQGERFDKAVPTGGFAEALYRPATDHETRIVLDALDGTDPVVEVGTVVGTDGVPARLRATGFSRHTFLCGQSGSGKTYATGVLLERLRLATRLPLVILDPNSDHVHLGDVRADADAALADRYAHLGGDVMVARARGCGGDVTLAVHLSDLGEPEQSQLLGLDPVRDLHEYAAYRAAVATLGGHYTVADLQAAADGLGTTAGNDLALRITNLGIHHWGLWCTDDEASFVDQTPMQRACVVLDLGSLATAAERTLVSAAVLRWLWARRAEKHPGLLVVDEAHNVFPAMPGTPLEAAATDLGIAIAAEGRKYGIHLFLATQRPAKVHPNVVSQCDNLALLRVNSVADVDDLCRIFSHVPAALIRQAPEFVLGDLLFAGPITTMPLRARIGARLSPEGGGDLPTDWAHRGPDR